MKLPDEERASHRAAFKSMSVPEKLDYVFSYYKLPLVLTLIAVVALGSFAYYRLSRKEPVLYLACANVAISDEVSAMLNGEYLAATGQDRAHHEVYQYRDLYLSDHASMADHQYAYASRIKLLAAIDSQRLDVVVMNEEAFQFLDSRDYLLVLDNGTTSYELGSQSLFGAAGFADTLRVGVIANSPRLAEAKSFMEYIGATH
ncbi:MAG: hypothetical protein IJ125_01190 [Atopobiaceae bacterium]|nr:hypothetical protein [Atopobiaceae bacterium]